VHDNGHMKNAPTTRKENQIAQLSIVCAHSPPLTYLSRAGFLFSWWARFSRSYCRRHRSWAVVGRTRHDLPRGDSRRDSGQ
ncbi:MAG: hypothetical protein AAFN65_01335, partial [Bacteroidota bacterium]